MLPPSFTKKACKFVIKRDSKNFPEVAKVIERLQQNASAKLRFSDLIQGKSSNRVFFTKIEDHNFVRRTTSIDRSILTNIAGCYQNRNPSHIF